MATNLKATHIQIIRLLQTVHINLNVTYFTGIVCILQALIEYQCWFLEKGNWNMYFFKACVGWHLRVFTWNTFLVGFDYLPHKKRDKASGVCRLWLKLTSFFTNYIGCSSTAALNSVYKSHFDRYTSPILGPTMQLLTPWYQQAFCALNKAKPPPARASTNTHFLSLHVLGCLLPLPGPALIYWNVADRQTSLCGSQRKGTVR